VNSRALVMNGDDADLARMSHELMSRDREDGCATEQPQGLEPEAYSFGTSQGVVFFLFRPLGARPPHARKDGHIRGRSKRFMKYPG
jgi:hypothetical protein